MADIADGDGLEAWLEGKPTEFVCVIAARAALRVAPVLCQALGEDAEARRREVVLPSLRALAAANFAGAWPGRVAEIRKAARDVARETREAISDAATGARLSVVEATEAVPEAHEYIWGIEWDARALEIAGRAVDAAVNSVQSAVDIVDAEKGIASCR